MDDLHYPNMSQCGIIIEENLDHVGMDPPDTKIPSELTQILNQPLPDMYDFYIENQVRRRKEQKDVDPTKIVFVEDNTNPTNNNNNNNNLTEKQISTLNHLKTVTGETDSVVLPILKRHNFALHESVNAYYRGER